MANIYIDLVPGEQICITNPNPNQIMINFLNVYHPRDVVMGVYLRKLAEQSGINPDFNVHQMLVLPANEQKLVTRHRNYVTLCNLEIDDPDLFSPNDLNKSCSKRLRDAISLLKTTTMKSIIQDISKDKQGYHGIVKVYIDSEEMKKLLQSYHGKKIGNRVCYVMSGKRRISAYRCFRCQSYDHDIRSCSSMVDVCMKCAGNHCYSRCSVLDQEAFLCINCLRAKLENVNHMAGTFYCPLEKQQRALRDGSKVKRVDKENENVKIVEKCRPTML